MPPLAPGDVIRVEEPDYLYGVGPVVLRVTAVGVVERLPDGWWLNLRGIALRVNGSPRGLCERYVVVRLAALYRLASLGCGRDR